MTRTTVVPLAVFGAAALVAWWVKGIHWKYSFSLFVFSCFATWRLILLQMFFESVVQSWCQSIVSNPLVFQSEKWKEGRFCVEIVSWIRGYTSGSKRDQRSKIESLRIFRQWNKPTLWLFACLCRRDWEERDVFPRSTSMFSKSSLSLWGGQRTDKQSVGSIFRCALVKGLKVMLAGRLWLAGGQEAHSLAPPCQGRLPRQRLQHISTQSFVIHCKN